MRFTVFKLPTSPPQTDFHRHSCARWSSNGTQSAQVGSCNQLYPKSLRLSGGSERSQSFVSQEVVKGEEQDSTDSAVHHADPSEYLMSTPLHAAIKRSGRTQRFWARQTGITERRLSDFCTGWAIAREREREALARALGVAVHDLFPASVESTADAYSEQTAPGSGGRS
jgi:hypothetical protein